MLILAIITNRNIYLYGPKGSKQALLQGFSVDTHYSVCGSLSGRPKEEAAPREARDRWALEQFITALADTGLDGFSCNIGVSAALAGVNSGFGDCLEITGISVCSG